MENSQVILLRDYYNTDNGDGKPLAFSCSTIFNNEISFCNTDNFIVYDDDNAIIHAVMLTKDTVARQAETPYRICSGFYGNIQYMEGCFDMSGLKDAVQKMFVDTGLIDETQQESIMTWAGSIRNSIPKRDNVPYFTDVPLTPASFPDPTKPVRNDGMLRSTAKITSYTDYIKSAMVAAVAASEADIRIDNTTNYRIAIDDTTEFAATIGDIVTMLMADEGIFQVSVNVNNSKYAYAMYNDESDSTESEENLIKMTAYYDKIYMRVYYETSSVMYIITRVDTDTPMTANEYKNYVNSAITEFVDGTTIDSGSITFDGKNVIEIKTDAPLDELVNDDGVTFVETIMGLDQTMLFVNTYAGINVDKTVVEFNKDISAIGYGKRAMIRLAILDRNAGTKYYYNIAVMVATEVIPDTSVEDMAAAIVTIEDYDYPDMANTTTADEALASVTESVNTVLVECADDIELVEVATVSYTAPTEGVEGSYLFTVELSNSNGNIVTDEITVLILALEVVNTTIEVVDALVDAIEAYTFGPMDSSMTKNEMKADFISAITSMPEYDADVIASVTVNNVEFTYSTDEAEGQFVFTATIVSTSDYTATTENCTAIISIPESSSEEDLATLIAAIEAYTFGPMTDTMSEDEMKASIMTDINALEDCGADAITALAVNTVETVDPSTTDEGSYSFTVDVSIADNVSSSTATCVAVISVHIETDDDKLAAAAALVMAYDFGSLPNTVTTSSGADSYLSNIVADELMPSFATYLSCNIVVSEFTASTSSTEGSCTFYGALYYNSNTLNTDSITIAVDMLEAVEEPTVLESIVDIIENNTYGPYDYGTTSIQATVNVADTTNTIAADLITDSMVFNVNTVEFTDATAEADGSFMFTITITDDGDSITTDTCTAVISMGGDSEI